MCVQRAALVLLLFSECSPFRTWCYGQHREGGLVFWMQVVYVSKMFAYVNWTSPTWEVWLCTVVKTITLHNEAALLVYLPSEGTSSSTSAPPWLFLCFPFPGNIKIVSPVRKQMDAVCLSQLFSPLIWNSSTCHATQMDAQQNRKFFPSFQPPVCADGHEKKKNAGRPPSSCGIGPSAVATVSVPVELWLKTLTHCLMPMFIAHRCLCACCSV